MANPARGEVDIVTPQKTYTLFLSTNAVCELQGRTGKTYGQVLRGIGDLDFVGLREIVWAVLKKNHRKEFATVESVGEWMDEIGSDVVQKAVAELFVLNMPKAAQDQEDKARPPQDGDAAPSDGTGNNSTSTAAATA